MDKDDMTARTKAIGSILEIPVEGFLAPLAGEQPSRSANRTRNRARENQYGS
jgi:hypothetical protein